MGNGLFTYSRGNMNCFENKDTCSKACGAFDCLYVDKCGDSSFYHYVCVPYDANFIMWLLVGIFVVVVLCCSAIVVCYALRAIRVSFRKNPIATDRDIVFYNAKNVHAFPHPANIVWGRPPQPPLSKQPSNGGGGGGNGSVNGGGGGGGYQWKPQHSIGGKYGNGGSGLGFAGGSFRNGGGGYGSNGFARNGNGRRSQNSSRQQQLYY